VTLIGKPYIPSSPAFPIFDSKDLIGVEIDNVDAKLNWSVMKSAMTSPSLASSQIDPCGVRTSALALGALGSSRQFSSHESH
jgi:hypothetical protein